jgi:hypothetical protein
MTVENDFLAFATGVDANVESQSAYVADTATIQNGFQSGIANSEKLNKVWRQSSIMAAVMAQFIVQQTGQPAIDDGTTATLLANLETAVAVSARQNPVLADTGTANTYAVANLSAFSAYPTVSGLVIDISIANANTGASTLNVDGLGAKPIYGLGLQALQGGELIVKGVASLLYIVASTVNSGNGAWILMECAGGAQQVSPGTQSNHAVNLGQFASSLGANGYTKLPNGLIIQWLNGVSASSGIMTQAWPITFPNNVLSANCTYVANGAALAVTVATMSTNTTNSTCVVNVATGSGTAVASANVKVIAVGY